MTTSGQSKKRSSKKETYAEDRLLPSAIEIEDALLGNVIFFSDTPMGKIIINEIFPQMFYDPVHQKICATIKKMADEQIAIDILTVSQYIKNYNLNEFNMTFGEIAHKITTLTNKTTSPHVAYEYMLIVYQKYVQRRIIEICHTYSDKAWDDHEDPFNIIEKIEKSLQKINPMTKVKAMQNSDSVVDVVENNLITPIGDIILPMTTGWTKFDRIIGTNADSIYIVAGATGHGKTKFVNAWMTKLLHNYSDDISIQWNTFEDSAREVYMQWLGYHVMHTSKEISGRKFPISLRPVIKEKGDIFKKYDIEFYDRSERMAVIARRFATFCIKRPDRFNILVIDNLMSLKDVEDYGGNLITAQDIIAQRILECRQTTKAMIVLVHHFNKEERKNTNRLSTGYRPLTADLKGTEGFERISNTVLLLNNPRLYKDLMGDYRGKRKEVLENLIILEGGKTRGTRNVSNENLMHFYGDLDYNVFVEIPEILDEI